MRQIGSAPAAPATRARLSAALARTVETFAFWQVNSGGFDANVQTWDFLANAPLVFDQFVVSPPEMAGRQIEFLVGGTVVASGVLGAGAQLSLTAPVTVGTGKTLRVRLTRTAGGDVYVGQRDTLPAGATVAGGALKFLSASTNNYAPAMRWVLGADLPKSVDGPLDASDFPVVTSLAQLLPGQVALLDNGVDPPRMVRKRLDGSLPPTALEVELAALRAALPLPRVGIRSVLPRVARDGSEGDAWTYAPILKNTDPVGDWAPDLAGGWVTVPRTGVYTVSVTYVLICNGSQAYNIVLFSDTGGGNEKMKVTEGRADGAVGGTAAGIIQAVAGERFRLGFRTGGSAFLYELDLNHWTIRQEAD